MTIFILAVFAFIVLLCMNDNDKKIRPKEYRLVNGEIVQIKTREEIKQLIDANKMRY